MASKSLSKSSGPPMSHEEGGVTTGALATQVSTIVANLNKKNLKNALNELSALHAAHDPPLVEMVTMRQLVSQIDWKNTKMPRDQAKLQLLGQKITHALTLPNYATILCTALDDTPLANENLFTHLTGTLKLSQATVVTVALACSLSLSQALKTLGIKYLHTTLPSLVSGTTLAMDKLSEPLAHDLIAFINDDGSFPSKSAVLKAFENVYGDVPVIAALFSSSSSGSGPTPASVLLEARKAITLAGLLADSGPACTSSAENLRKVLDQAPQPSSESYAEVITLVVHSQAHQARRGTPWDLRVLAAGLREKAPTMNWDEVIGALDHAKCSVVDIDALHVLIDLHQLASNNAPFPVEELLKPWANTAAQCTLLCTALTAAYDALTFPPTEELVAAAEGLSVPLNASNSNFIQPYYCLPLVSALLRLSADNASQYSAVWSLLQAGPVTHCPAVLLVALAMAKPACALRDRLALALLSLILPVNSQHQSADIVNRLWRLDKELVVNAFVAIYEAEPATLSRILDVTLEIQELKAVLDWKPLIMFSVDLACLASLRDALDLSRWLDDAVQKFGPQAADLLISFARDRLERQRAQSPRSREGRPTHTVVSPEAFQTIFDRLKNASNALTPQQQEELNKLVAAAGETAGFPADVEDEANKNFQLIYSGALTVDDAIAMLSKYKAATQSSRELKVFQCMIRNLFDEYRFFPKYPDAELKLTGVLFGSLVQHHLISYIPLGIALRYVLDALKSPPNSKLFKFGIYALEQFTSRLAEWPQYCLHLKQVPALRQLHPQLAQVIDANSLAPVSSSPSSSHAFTQHMEANIYHGSPPSAAPVHEHSLPVPPVTAAPTLALPPTVTQKEREPEDAISSHALNIKTLTDDAERIVKPSEDVQDTIHFIFNNVSPQNIDQKVSELKKVVQPQFYDYLAQYVVTKRASLEENFQELYVEFLERLNLKELNKKLLAQACRSIRALIASDKIRTEMSERSLLKNLANFVGLLTIAKDRPLLHILLPLKNMLVESYETGKLIAVVPFVSKIIGKAAKTHWFRLPNPWTMSIVKTLVEVYHLPNVKLPLKFEIEILSGVLEFSIAEIQPSELLRNRRAYGGPGPIIDFEGGPPSLESAEERAAANAAKYQLQYVHLNPSLPMFSQQPALKKAVYVAINRAIHDILAPVVERSVVIGSVTTKELVLKDYAMEPDEAKLMRAALGMVQSLAGNLAAVTCKESLRGTMVANLRTALAPPVVPGKPAPPTAHLDHAIQLIVQDNIELACAVVQRAAADAALRPTEEHLSAAVQERKRHKERSNGKESFYDMNFVGSPAYSFATTLPEFLRPKMGGVTAQQMQVYDEFVSAAQAGYGNTPSPPASRLASTGGFGDKDLLRRSTGGDMPFEQALKVVDQFILDLLSAASLVPPSVRSFSELPADHALHTNVAHAADLLNIAPQQRVEIALHATQRAFVKLFDERTTPVAREVLTAVLDNLAAASPKVKQHLTELLLYAPEPQRYHREVVPILLHSKLVSIADFDVTLAKAISTYHRDAVEFGAFLVQNLVFKAQALAKADLLHSLEQLIKIGAVSSDIVSAMSDLPPIDPAERPQFDVNSVKNPPAPLEQKLNTLVDEWLKICATGAINEKAQAAFAHKLQQGGFYGGKDAPLTNELAFYAVCLDLAVKKCGMGATLDYTALGHIARLFVVLVKYFPEKPLLLARLLCVTEAVISATHQASGADFDQRPFHRLYASLLGDLTTPDPVLEPHAFSLAVEIAHSLHALRPTLLPGFSFAWVELIASRLLLPKLLKEPVLWAYMETLVVDLLAFLQTVTKDCTTTSDASTPSGSLYRGTLRIMLVLLHDFPEFLCEYHFSLCDAMPPNCVQLRNLVLAAFPRAMKLPDPFTPNLKVDLLPEIKEPPHIRSAYVDVLEKLSDGFPLRAQLDLFLKSSEPSKVFLGDLVAHLRNPTAPAGQRYKRQLINALVLYIGARALSENAAEFNPPQAPMEILRHLATNFDTEGRYVLFNAIANQLRYPNNHTHYFSCVLLFLFAEATQEIVQEQITRVLVERLIVHRPHPWGLLITFIELIKNPRYSFWNRNFTHIAPEIERLFFQVGSSIASHKTGGEA